MNEIVNEVLLAGDKFMPEIHLRQPVFTYSTGSFTKIRKNTKIQRNSRFTIYLSNVLDKVCFKLDMVYGDFKDLTRRTASDKILRDESFNNAKKILNMMDINVELLQLFTLFLIKKLLAVALRLKINLLLKMKIYQTKY